MLAIVTMLKEGMPITWDFVSSAAAKSDDEDLINAVYHARCAGWSAKFCAIVHLVTMANNDELTVKLASHLTEAEKVKLNPIVKAMKRTE